MRTFSRLTGPGFRRVATRAAYGLAAVVSLAAVAPSAWALDVCTGVYSGGALHPLPSPAVVQFQSMLNSQELIALQDRFLTGLRRAGISFDGTPTLQMNVTAAVTPPNAAVAAPPQTGSYTGFGWAGDTSANAASVIGGTLNMSLTLTNATTYETNWVGTVSCTVQTNDKPLLAEEIGELLGRSFGQNFIERRM
jgi:hypothetical protein